MRIGFALAYSSVLTACSERYCTDPGICWANRNDVISAASRCGVESFELKVVGNNVLPWVPGENPDNGLKTRCIIRDLKLKNLQVAH